MRSEELIDIDNDMEKEDRKLAAKYGPPELRESILKEDEAARSLEKEREATMEPEPETFISEENMKMEKPETIVSEENRKMEKPEIMVSEESEEFGIIGNFANGLLSLFSPILMPLYVTILIFELSMLSVVPGNVKLSFTLIAFGICCVLPWLLIYVLKRSGFISDWQLSERRERTLPYSFMFFALGGTALFFAVKGAPSWMWFIYIGGATSALVNMLVNFRWKICCHATAAAALVATMVVIQSSGLPQVGMMWWEIGTILLAGAVGSACLIARTHSLLQVLAGYATGFIPIILFAI